MDDSLPAFLAYNNGLTKSPKATKSKSATKNTSLKGLSHAEMVAAVISKKKKQMKRKSNDESFTEAPSNPPKLPRKEKPGNLANGQKKNQKNSTKKKKSQSEEKVVSSKPTTEANHTADTFVDRTHSTPKPAKTSKIVHPQSPKVTNGSPPKTVHSSHTPIRTPHDAVIATPKTTKLSQNASKPERRIAAKNIGSIEAGQQLFSWLIKPIEVTAFMSKNWEQNPMLVERKCPAYYADIISIDVIDKMLRENYVEFTKNIDITSYKEGVRETHNPEGRAMSPAVWGFYRDGCSIRILNPQTFIPRVHSLNATLQEYFQCMTGANVYLTPANSQGFAPHYDDIEAFVLQIEGKKHWKVYKPRSTNEYLPRESSVNFAQDEIGDPILDTIVEAGDVLYFPRGYIHQASTVPGHHSLHITLSVYQKHSYGDLLEILLPMALQAAISENVSLRQGLPLNIWQCMGLVNSDEESQERTNLMEKIKSSFALIFKSPPIDDAIDQMAIRYQHDALPPYLSPVEQTKTVYKTASFLAEDGTVDHPTIEMATEIRLVRANILRMVRYKDEFRIYYHSDNSKEYHAMEETFAEIGSEHAPAVEILIKSYPEYVTPGQLQLENDEQNLAVAQDLWERGLLMTKHVLTAE